MKRVTVGSVTATVTDSGKGRTALVNLHRSTTPTSIMGVVGMNQMNIKARHRHLQHDFMLRRSKPHRVHVPCHAVWRHERRIGVAFDTSLASKPSLAA